MNTIQPQASSQVLSPNSSILKLSVAEKSRRYFEKNGSWASVKELMTLWGANSESHVRGLCNYWVDQGIAVCDDCNSPYRYRGGHVEQRGKGSAIVKNQ